MTSTIAIKTTVQIDWTSAPTVRITANVDMPEYGITSGQVVYLVRASANDGTYYIVRWSYTAVEWQCPCKSFKPCKHLKAVNAACVTRKGVMQKLALLAKAAEERATFEKNWGHCCLPKKAAPERGVLNGSSRGFTVLLNNGSNRKSA